MYVRPYKGRTLAGVSVIEQATGLFTLDAPQSNFGGLLQNDFPEAVAFS